MPMNILCLDQYGEFGGAQRTLVELLPSFRENRWSVAAALPEGPVAQALRESGHPVHPMDATCYAKVRKTRRDMAMFAWRGPRTVRFLHNIARAHESRLIYVNGPRLLPAAALVARWRRLALLFHCHNRIHQASAVALAGRSLQIAGAQVVACCRYAAEPLISYLPSDNLHVYYNGVNAMPLPPLREATAIRRIGVVGRVEAEKGQLEFVQAAHILLQQLPQLELEFIMIGAPLFSSDGYFSAVRSAAEGLPIRFVGWQGNMQDVFASIDLLVVPSTALDAAPRVVMEAQAAGVPVVAFAVGGIPEIIRDLETGFLVSLRTAAALAKKIAHVLTIDPITLAGIRQQARETTQRTYCLKSYRNSICKLIGEMALAA